LVACLAAAILIAIAARHAQRVTAPLESPYDADLFRDMASAQAVVQGEDVADPFYRGETFWYNPLVPALVAATSRATGIAIRRLYSAYGWVFNLVVPVAFFALVWLCGGAWAAVGSLLIFLYFPSPRMPPWEWASYSPWLFPTVFAQALFCITLIAVAAAWRSSRFSRYAVAGCMLGITFLAHTAPALLVAAAICVEAIRRLRRPAFAVFARGTGVIFVLAAASSLPLTVSIVGRYRLHVLNPAPSSWGSLGSLSSLLAETLTLPGALALFGVWWLVSNATRRARARILIAWAMSNFAWLAWMYACQIVKPLGWSMPSLLPSYHFLFYWRALVPALAGCGAVGLVQLTARGIGYARGRAPGGPAIEGTVACVVILAILVALPSTYPAFASRYDFREAVAGSRERTRRQDQMLAFDWIRRQTPKECVFLADDDIALFVVGPAGRKTVVVGPFFSNPYVDWTGRAHARRLMWNALQAGDSRSFCALARPFGVTHVVLSEQVSLAWAGPMKTFMAPAFGVGDVRIWKIVGCGSS
jgi:hypothetical protein